MGSLKRRLRNNHRPTHVTLRQRELGSTDFCERCKTPTDYEWSPWGDGEQIADGAVLCELCANRAFAKVVANVKGK